MRGTSVIDQIIIGIYLFLILLIGIIAGRKNNDFESFAVASRTLPLLLIFSTLTVTLLYQNNTLDNAEKVFLLGIYHIIALFGYSIREFLIARFIAPQMDKYSKCLSIGDIIEQHYGKTAKILTGIFSVILSTLIVSILLTVLGYLMNLFLGINTIYGVLIGAGIITIYASLGGLKSITYTHVLQFFMIIIVIPLIIYYGVTQADGWSNVLSAVPNKHLSIFGNISFIAFLSLFFSFMLAETLLPPYVQRLLANRNSQTVSRAVLLNGMFSVFIFIATGLIGLIAFALFPTAEASIALPKILMSILPIGVKGLAIAGILSIIISSADSFLNSAAVSITNDILKPVFKNSKTIASITTARVFTIVLGISASLMAIFIKDLSVLLIYPLLFWSPIILVPLVVAILGFGVTKKQLYQSAFAGILTVTFWTYGLKNLFEINGLIIGVLASLFVFVYLAFFDKKTPSP